MSKKFRQTSRTNNTSQQNANKTRIALSVSGAAGAEQQRLVELVARGDYDRAIQFLHATGKGSASQHDKAVCLMRLGRFAEAVEILRKLVLNHDCVWMRPDVPLVYKTNFATALLLGGHPAGCRSLLGELDDGTIPAVIKMREILSNWEKTMNFWQRLNWRWMGIEPENKPVLFDGVAGDFETAMVERVQSGLSGSPNSSLHVAT
jgi:hypothetical protein